MKNYNTDEQFQRDIQTMLAAHYTRQLSERVKRGMAEAKKRGQEIYRVRKER